VGELRTTGAGETAQVTDTTEELIDLSIDPDGDPYWIACWGPKHSGKSYFARAYFDTWPYDRICIDPTRDFDPDNRFSTDWAGGPAFPELERGQERVSLRYVPNRRDPNWRVTLEQVLWAVVSAGEDGRRVFLHVDEIKIAYSVGHVSGAGETILNEGRHYGIFQSTCGPRTKGVDPLTITQADSNCVFGHLHELDAARLAECTSVNKDDLAAIVDHLDEHGFARVLSAPPRVIVYPAIPEEAPA
jgi:hypothetical protein